MRAVPFENAFVVADAPFLRPLAAALEEAPSTLIVFVDGESARLIPLSAEGTGEEVAFQSDVPGHHRRGGWGECGTLESGLARIGGVAALLRYPL